MQVCGPDNRPWQSTWKVRTPSRGCSSDALKVGPDAVEHAARAIVESASARASLFTVTSSKLGLTEARRGLRGGLVLLSRPPRAVRLVSRRRCGATRYFH